jgi:hypothetical protein
VVLSKAPEGGSFYLSLSFGRTITPVHAKPLSGVTPSTGKTRYKEPMIYIAIGLIIGTLALWKVAREDRR